MMTNAFHIQTSSSNYQNWSVSYGSSKPTTPTQSFQDNLWRSQQVNQANSQTISELVSVMKDNVRAKFDTGLVNTWNFLNIMQKIRSPQQ